MMELGKEGIQLCLSWRQQDCSLGVSLLVLGFNDCAPKYHGGTHLELAGGNLHVSLPAYCEQLLKPVLQLPDILRRGEHVIYVLPVSFLIAKRRVCEQIKIICTAHQTLGQGCKTVLATC